MLDQNRDLLITTSLIGAVEWFIKSPSSWKDRAYTGLIDALSRKFTPNPAVERGMAFERKINAAITLPTEKDFLDFFKDEKPTEKVVEFYKECFGGQQQKVLKKFVTINEQSYCLYGKSDIYFPSIIKDIKTTHSWKGKNNYLSTTQHLMYCYIAAIPNFKYIVGIFDDDNDGKLVDVQTVSFTADMTLLENQLFDRIKDCITIIENDADLKKLYLTKFCLY